jgi:nitronate monooxygenase
MVETALMRAWDLRHPVVGAPMGHVSHGELAGAVSEAGGLGFLAVSAQDREWIEAEASVARERGARFGVGFIGWILDAQPELFDAVATIEPFAVSLSFHDPVPWAPRVRDAGARLVVQVQDRASLDRALEAEADAIVIQGADAGGHTADHGIGTLPLIQALAPAVEDAGVPWMAAGGIATGRALAGVLAMGAGAGWIGTALRFTPEAEQAEALVDKLLAAGEDDTVIGTEFDKARGVPWPEHFPGRALRGPLDEPAVWASAGVAAIDAVRPTREVVETLSRDAAEWLARTRS